MAAKKSKEIIIFLFLVLAIFCLLPSKSQAQTINAPTINSISATDINTATIRGTTTANMDIMFFLDNQFFGSAAASLTENSSADVAYTYVLKKDLANGQHILSAIAHDRQTNVISDYSRPFIFIVSDKKEIRIGVQANVKMNEGLPSAPVLQDPPVVNNEDQLVVTGWAKNNLTINIFLDEKLLTSFPVNNSETGTANFSYALHQTLANGGHLLYATAIDDSSKESIRSNYLYYLTDGSNSSKPSSAVGEQNNTEPIKISAENKINDNTDQALSNILKQTQVTDKDKSGMVDESKEMQGKLKWNLIIFILFLVAVIVWIIWVNRELIKEKREQNKKVEEKNSQDKLV
jgi:hypothetical protein